MKPTAPPLTSSVPAGAPPQAGAAQRPKARLSLRTNVAWTLAGNVVYAGCQWAMLIVLAKLGTPADVGMFSLGLAVTAPVMLLANLQLRQLQATDARGEYLFGDYLALRLATTALALAVVGGIVAAGGYDRSTALTVLWIGLAKAFECISDVYYGLLQQQERMDRISQSMIVKGPLSLAAMAAGVYLSGSVVGGAAGLAAAWALLLAGFDMPSAAWLTRRAAAEQTAQAAAGSLAPRWHGPTMLRIAWLALPLGVVMMLISLNANLPRYFIEGRLGADQLGIFAAMAYLMQAGAQVVHAVGQAATPRLARYYAADDPRDFHRLLRRLLLIGAVLGAGGVTVALVAGRWVLTLLYKPVYAERADVFLVLMAAAAFTYLSSMFGYAATAARHIRSQPVIYGGMVLATAASCLLLIEPYGLMGAALAVLASSIAGTLGFGLLALLRENQ